MKAVLTAMFWAAVGGTVAWHMLPPDSQVHYQTVIQQAPPVERIPSDTPYADSLVDFDEVERDTDCLWVILREQFGWDITMERVTAAALWTYELGGACAVLEGDGG